DEVVRLDGAHQQLLEESLEAGVEDVRALGGEERAPLAALAGHRVDRSRGPAHLDGPDLAQIPGERGLGDGAPQRGQAGGELGLRRDRLPLDERHDELLPGGLRGQLLSSHVSSAFCAWSRFSASSNTTDAGPSMTEAATSLPRYAGRQWRKIGSSPRLMSSSVTWKGANGDDSSSRPWASCPIDTHVSVTSTFAPAAASAASSVTVREPPVRWARARASATIASAGWYPAGAAMRTCMPA